ncbi:MAG TPA: acyl-CoA dehydrogenase family protein, partial [bacterium]|nr:acyl-CoA dehydrogenase family protein [bacterium]
MFELTPAQQDLQARARALAQGPIAAHAAEVDRSEQYPWANVEQLTRAGFMGMTVPRALGGPGLGYLETVLVVEELAKACGVTGRIVVEGNMGAIGAILRYGSPAQQELAAKLVLAGDKPAICITEPGAGSAATEMTTTAVRTPQGYVLSGGKHWITGGGVSRLHLIFARLVEDGQALGIAGFIALRDEHPGLIIGPREPTMGLRGIPEARLTFNNLLLGLDRILVPPEGVRRGFAGLMNAYNSQRVGAGTVALGIAQGAYEAALAYAKERKQFGRPIAEFQGLQWLLADMRIQLDAARLMLWRAAASAEISGTGFPDALLAAEAKILASEVAIKVTND